MASVRRPNGVSISGGICRQSQWDVGPDDPDVNILVVLLLTVPAKGNLATIGRKTGVAFLTRKTGQLEDFFFLAAIHGDFPYPVHLHAFRVVDETAVPRFEGYPLSSAKGLKC